MSIKLIQERLNSYNCKSELEEEHAIKSIAWKRMAEDVRRFVRVAEQPLLNLWSKELFLAQLEKLK